MILVPKTSYYIKSSSDFISHIVINYLIYLNSIHGVNMGQNIFGNMLVVSNTDNPSKNKTVISMEERGDPFLTVDVDENWVKIFCQMEGIKNPEVMKFITILKGSLDEKYSVIKRILHTTSQSSFDKELASSIVNKEYKLKFSTKDKINSLIALVNDFSKTSWMTFVHHTDEGDFGLIISSLEKANNGEIKQIQSTPLTTKNLLNISISALKSETFHEFHLNLMRLILKNG